MLIDNIIAGDLGSDCYSRMRVLLQTLAPQSVNSERDVT